MYDVSIQMICAYIPINIGYCIFIEVRSYISTLTLRSATVGSFVPGEKPHKLAARGTYYFYYH
jgi:hypothetical protein